MGIRLFNPPRAAVTIGVVRPDKAGMASGTGEAVQQVGVAVSGAGPGDGGGPFRLAGSPADVMVVCALWSPLSARPSRALALALVPAAVLAGTADHGC
ncbi:hypothetical protein AB0I82_06575 [Streptomyces sp. NPDC050315]|uniref:hypothetical protein n=1 Tax=Streptomyces sp. NPDC050315 TaxID=3155039 RepID=UPI003443D3E9